MLTIKDQICTSRRMFANMLLGEIKTGVFSTLERILIEHPEQKINYITNIVPYKYNRYINSENVVFNQTVPAIENKDEIILDQSEYYPWKLVSELSERIIKDYELICSKGMMGYKCFEVDNSCGNVLVEGDVKQIICKEMPKIKGGVFFDVTNGPIIIDENVTLSPFTAVYGPVYIGANTIIQNAKLSDGVVIGNNCKVEGDLSNSIIGEYTNKVHNGGILNSYIGDWCNIGGNTNTAPLKLDYSKVSVSLDFKNKREMFNTERIQFGSIICDYCRLGISLNLQPGTFIDIGATVIKGPSVKGYISPFSWLDSKRKISFNRFTDMLNNMMERRKKFIDRDFRTTLESVYNAV